MNWARESGIALISNKEVEPDYMPKLQTPWDFVERHYPNYSSSDEIAHEGDLDKLVHGEYDEGDCAHQLLMDEYDGDINNPQIKIDHEVALCSVYAAAIQGYIETIQ